MAKNNSGGSVKVKALTPIQHDGDLYAEGDVLTATAAQAQALIDGGHAVAVGAPAEPEEPKQ